MILEHRTYTFKPGTVDKWLEKYKAEGLPVQKRHLNTFVGLYVAEIGHLHTTVLMWAYESLADRETRRTAMYHDPEWQKFIGEIWDLEAILTQDVMIMNPASYSPEIIGASTDAAK
ncbi:NIPSNAP family protein, partial [Paraburkholderia aspalathi]|nr:NIPSNAP family protein [Paraburkholderia aspalathi]